MFSKKKRVESRYVIAVKDYDDTLSKLEAGELSLPYDKGIYLKMLESQNMRVDNLKELRKFTKATGKSKKDVGHYWEGLIVDGYALVNIEYDEKVPSIDHVCNNNFFKYVTTV